MRSLRTAASALAVALLSAAALPVEARESHFIDRLEGKLAPREAPAGAFQLEKGQTSSFQNLDLQLKELEREITRNAVELVELRRGLKNRARAANRVVIALQTDDLALEEAEVSLDNRVIYQSESELPIAAPTLSLFQGALATGSHRIDIRAGVRLPGKAGSEPRRIINKSFRIDIPKGKVKKRYAIVFSAKGSRAEVRLQESG